MNTKIKVFSNIGIVLSRILELKGEKGEVGTICATLLSKNLDA
jgi:hypothetical protein